MNEAVPETFFFTTCTVSAPYVNAERTQSELCVNAELNMVNDE